MQAPHSESSQPSLEPVSPIESRTAASKLVPGSTALASLVGFGEFPPLASVVLIAGRIPRAEALAHYFERPIRVPSLHVWGLADNVSGTHAPRLFERFDVRTRECSIWTGPHVVPSHGPAKDAIVEFLLRRR